MRVELTLFWAALSAYGLSFTLQALSLALGRPRLAPAYRALVLGGVAAHALALTWRGFSQGSPPFISYYESVSFGVWLDSLFYLWLKRRQPSFEGAWLALGPANLLLMGSACLSAHEFAPLAAPLQSWWLAVHVLFALAAFACLALAFGLALLLLAPPGLARPAWLPGPSASDDYFFRFLALAFLFQLVMLVAGSIWADQAWGRFWGWDPIETASLLTLLVEALAIHLRLHFGWRGRRLAGLLVLAFLLTVFSIWGVPYLSQSIHLYQKP